LNEGLAYLVQNKSRRRRTVGIYMLLKGRVIAVLNDAPYHARHMGV
jgi:hypothetical protein